MIISLLLTTFSIDCVLLLWGEDWCLSLLGLYPFTAKFSQEQISTKFQNFWNSDKLKILTIVCLLSLLVKCHDYLTFGYENGRMTKVGQPVQISHSVVINFVRCTMYMYFILSCSLMQQSVIRQFLSKILLCPTKSWHYEWRDCIHVYVVVNSVSQVNFYFSFVSTSLAYITWPYLRTKEKQKLPEIKNYLQHVHVSKIIIL